MGLVHILGQALVALTFFSLAISAEPATTVTSVSDNSTLDTANSLGEPRGQIVPNNFYIRPVPRQQSLDGKDIALTAVLFARDIAQYDSETEQRDETWVAPNLPNVGIGLQGRPGKQFLRKHALWGIYLGITFLTQQPQPVSTFFVLSVDEEEIGLVNFAPARSDARLDGIAAWGPNGDGARTNTTDASDQLLVLRGDQTKTRQRRKRSGTRRFSNKLLTREMQSVDESPANARVNGTLDNRSGVLKLSFGFHENKRMSLYDIAICGIGGIAYAASFGEMEVVEHFTVTAADNRYLVGVGYAETRSSIPFYFADAMSGIVGIVSTAFRLDKKFEPEVDVKWQQRDGTVTTLGHVVFRKTPSPSGADGQSGSRIGVKLAPVN